MAVLADVPFKSYSNLFLFINHISRHGFGRVVRKAICHNGPMGGGGGEGAYVYLRSFLI